MTNVSLVVIALLMFLRSPGFQALGQSKPAPAGVRPAAPAQVPGQSVKTTANKNYWVGRAASGGYMGVWVDHTPVGLRSVKFATGKDGLLVVIRTFDARGTPIAAEFNFIPPSPVKVGTKSAQVAGYASTVGRPAKTSSLVPDELMPCKLPPELEAKLRSLGAELEAVRKLKSFLEGKTAAERVLGSGLLDRGSPAAAISELSKRASGPPAKSPGSVGSKSPWSGQASDDGTPAKSDDGESLGDPSPEGGARLGDPATPQQHEDEAALARAETLAFEEAFDRDSKKAENERRATTDAAKESYRVYSAENGVLTEYVHYRDSSGGWHDRPLRQSVIIVEVPSGRAHGSGPARTPGDEGSGHPELDPQTWDVLRTTGLGTLIWNSWVAKTKTDFGSVLRQPTQGDDAGRGAGSAAPRLGRDSVINPSDTGRAIRPTPKIPDLKDPTKGDEGSGRPTPRPRP